MKSRSYIIPARAFSSPFSSGGQRDVAEPGPRAGWEALPSSRPCLVLHGGGMAFVLSFVLSHRIAAVGTPVVAQARTNRFCLGVVLYEMRFDVPAGRVTDETGLLRVGRRSAQNLVLCFLQPRFWLKLCIGLLSHLRELSASSETRRKVSRRDPPPADLRPRQRHTSNPCCTESVRTGF
jgi:hypothetical protein